MAKVAPKRDSVVLRLEPEPVEAHDTQDTSQNVQPRENTADLPPARKGRVDILQLLFWLSIVVAIAAATVSLAWQDAVGEAGSILLISLAATGLVVLLWLARGAGRWLGLFPDRGAAERAVAAHVAGPRYPWIESLDEPVLVTERGGAAVTCNQAYRELSEIASGLGESAGPVIFDRLFGGSVVMSKALFSLNRHAKNGHAVTEVLPAIALGRDERPTQFAASVSPLPGGKVIWRLREVTGNEERKVSADPKALYIEDAPVGFFVTRSDGSISYLNGWLRELLGLTEGETVRKVEDMMRIDSARMLLRDRKGDKSTRAMLTLIGRDGVEVPVQAVTTWSGKGADSSGRTVLTTTNATLFDRSHRLTAASASRPPRLDGDPMFDDAPFGVVRLDGSSVETAVVTDANPAMMELTGGRAAPGAKLSDLFTADEGNETLAETLVGAIDHAVALRLAGSDTCHVNVRIALDDLGAPAIAYVIDITEMKELETKLFQSSKMNAMGELAGGLAHDFNNMLTGIMLNCDQLMIRHPVGDPDYQQIRAIVEWSSSAAELIRMLKAYARKETLKREVIETTEWLSEFSLMLRQLVDERVAVEIVHGRDVPKIKFDKAKLETSLLNMATNARDAMLAKGGGTLTVRTSAANAAHAHNHGFNYVEQGDYLLIEVADTGTGIAQENLQKIFEPYFTTKDKNKGTGLGLSTAYGIIKQSGGYLCAESTVGKGTVFYLYLPALSAEEAAQPEPETHHDAARSRTQPADMSGRGRILLVEDEHGVRGIAKHLLESCGYEVTDAADAEAALAIIDEQPNSFDLLISDVILPGIDGPTMLKQAREKLGKARVIFISGYAERDLAKTLDEETSVAFLPKPFTLRQLAEKVKDELTPADAAA